MITEEMLSKSSERDHGKYNDKSFMNGLGNIPGFLGEYILADIRPDLKHVFTSYDYDFLQADGNTTVDSKCKTHKVPKAPLWNHEASICVDSLHQQVDNYVFSRVYYDKLNGCYPYGWIIGGISKKEFFEKARPLKKGQRDGDNGYVVRQDCYNFHYLNLHPIKIKQ